MQFVHPIFLVVDAIPLTCEQCFLYRRNLRNNMLTKNGDLDAVPIPPAPN